MDENKRDSGQEYVLTTDLATDLGGHNDRPDRTVLRGKIYRWFSLTRAAGTVSEATLQRLERAQENDTPPADKWNR